MLFSLEKVPFVYYCFCLPCLWGRIQKNITHTDVEKGNPHALLVGMQTGAATVETVWRAFKKLKRELPYDPVILLLGIYLKKLRTLIQKNIYIITSMFTAALFTMAKIWKQLRCLLLDDQL